MAYSGSFGSCTSLRVNTKRSQRLHKMVEWDNAHIIDLADIITKVAGESCSKCGGILDAMEHSVEDYNLIVCSACLADEDFKRDIFLSERAQIKQAEYEKEQKIKEIEYLEQKIDKLKREL